MQKKIFQLGLSFLMAAIMFTSAAYAEGACCKAGKGGNGGKHGKGEMGQMMKELNLTQEQKDKLQAEREKMQAGRDERRAEMKTAYKELQDAIDSKASDAVIKEKTAKLEAVKEKVKAQRAQHLETLKSVLTAEQYAKVSAKMEQHFNKEVGMDCCKDGKKADCCKGEGKGKGHGAMGKDCEMNKDAKKQTETKTEKNAK